MLRKWLLQNTLSNSYAHAMYNHMQCTVRTNHEQT